MSIDTDALHAVSGAPSRGGRRTATTRCTRTRRARPTSVKAARAPQNVLRTNWNIPPAD